MPQKDAVRKREGRLHAVPPLPGWRLGSVDKAEGWLILLEGADELAGALWLAVRGVLAWIETPPEHRRDLSRRPSPATEARDEAAGLAAPELVQPLGRFSTLRHSPESLTPKDVSIACRAVAEWADSRALFGTAAEFAEAAAKAEPLHASFATLAGKACRHAGFADRAGVWYARGFQLALRAGDSPECIRALLGFGKLLLDQGKHLEARRFFRRAARRAHHIGKRTQAAAAYHDLFTIAAELGRGPEALEMAARALRLYPVRHPQVPALAYDFAFHLLRQGHYSRAEQVLAITLPRLFRPDVRVIGLATYARVVASMGNRERWETASREALSRMNAAGPFAAAASIHLAEAARALADWPEAAARAEVALELAAARGEGMIEADARQLLRAVATRTPVAEETVPPEAERLDAIMSQFADRLRRWKHRPAP